MAILTKKDLSIVIPILNEEKNIIPLTNKIKKNLKKIKFEIIFVDDRSIDNSKKVLLSLKKKYKFFKPILRNEVSRDLTQSCFLGIEKSKSENILIMDGDMQHDPKYIKSIFQTYLNKELDVVVGARKLRKGPNKGLTEIRRFASILLIFFFSIFQIRTSDPMSGFFLFNKKIYLKNKKMYFGKGFKILADILINTKTTLNTKDVFINFKRRYESESKMNYRILLILIHFYLRSIIKKLFI